MTNITVKYTGEFGVRFCTHGKGIEQAENKLLNGQQLVLMTGQEALFKSEGEWDKCEAVIAGMMLNNTGFREGTINSLFIPGLSFIVARDIS